MNSIARTPLHDKQLCRFWITFKDVTLSSLRIGCGITAFDLADALDILEKNVFSSQETLDIESITENIDIQLLDQKHVISNMGLVTNRGFWFPLGY
jgi:hypothetical protein